MRKFLVIYILAVASCANASVNSLGMKMVEVPAGSFQMGQKDGEHDERPVHKVKISRPFYMSATEVSNTQYEQFDAKHRKYRGIRGISSEDDEPVVHVSWHDAVRFCEWLSEKEGEPYRLPTEAEWEYACRAGTDTAFSTGDKLPKKYYRNQPKEGSWEKDGIGKDKDLRKKKEKVAVDLSVGTMPPNKFGLHEMHGNVEEWCLDWYGPYPEEKRKDPRGPRDGIFKVTRGGSHNNYVRHLRSANRHATVPEDRHWIIGFRVVQAEMPEGQWDQPVELSANDPTVRQEKYNWAKPTEAPVFIPPMPFVIKDTQDPWLAALTHHHHPTLTWCDNGDMLAVWFNTRSEIGREMIIVGSRLRAGNKKWDRLRPFFVPADRNTTGSNILNDGKGNLIWLNSISESTHHRNQCCVMMKSADNGRTWSRPRIISNLDDRHKYTPEQSSFVNHKGDLVFGLDYAPLGFFKSNSCGSGLFISRDGGKTWIDRISGKKKPKAEQGGQDTLIAGRHPAIVELKDGSIMAMGRYANINNRMPCSISRDEGKTWKYHASPFLGVGGGQRAVLLRLREGPILFASFAPNKNDMVFVNSKGEEHKGQGLFATLSYDEGKSWGPLRLVTPDGPEYRMDGGGNTHGFTISDTRAEPRGYLSVIQTPDNMIHLISSRLHYRFNLSWLKEGQSP